MEGGFLDKAEQGSHRAQQGGSPGFPEGWAAVAEGFEGWQHPESCGLTAASRTLCSEDAPRHLFTSMELCLEILMCLATSGGKEELLSISKCDIC